MAEMVGSAFIQEIVSRVLGFVEGKREEKASQGRHVRRLEMAASDMELALERSAKLPIMDVSLLRKRKMIECGYIEAMDELKKQNRQQQAVPTVDQQQEPIVVRGVKKRKWLPSWILGANKKNLHDSSAGFLNSDAVKWYEQLGEFARNFMRDIESGCSLWHNIFICSPTIVRHLLQGKDVMYRLKQGNQISEFSITRARCDEERGVEAVLRYSHYKDDDAVMEGKYLHLQLTLRLSASTDIAGVAIKALQFLTSRLKLVVDESAKIMEDLILLPSLFHDTAHSYPSMSVKAFDALSARIWRPDPACCGARRHGLLCSNTNNNVLSSSSEELSHMFQRKLFLFILAARAGYPMTMRSPRAEASVAAEVVGRHLCNYQLLSCLILRFIGRCTVVARRPLRSEKLSSVEMAVAYSKRSKYYNHQTQQPVVSYASQS